MKPSANGIGATPARRRRLAAWLVVFTVGAGAAGFVAGSQMTSSAEIAANRQAPAASVLTATVEKRVLRSEIITRGTLVRASEFSLIAWPPGDPTIGSVVTVMPLHVGAALKEGGLAAEVGGRPVIALEGMLPAFRDLRLGDRGVDVDQLRASLWRLHLLADGNAGPFDDTVVAAIKALYASIGYLPNEGGKEKGDALIRARAQKQAAEAALKELQASRRQVSRSEQLQTEAAVAAAKNAEAIADAQTAAAVDAATRRHSSALHDLEAARGALGVARERLRQAEQDNRHPDTGLPPTAGELSELRHAVVEGSRLVRDAEDTEWQRRHEIEIAVLQRVAQMDAAAAAVELARTQLEDLGVVRAPTAAELDAAKLALRQADDGLADAQRAAVPFLPRSEVVFVPTLPGQVTKTLLARGDNLNGPLAQVSGSHLRLDATLPASAVTALRIGSIAVIDDVGTSIAFDAKLAEVGSAPLKDGADAGRFMVRLVPVASPPERAIGLSLRIRLPIESTDGDALIVPATALRTAVDGSVFVERYGKNGAERIPVKVVLAASGLAAVAPGWANELSAGDEVIVGSTEG